jgi:inositol 1,4,5-triphosphate receptor type 1/inositol 1,4,5-triphosphate receptor type 3
MNLHDANSLKDDLKIFFLKVLARIITEKNVRNKETLYSIDRWTPEFWSDCKSQIEGAQIFLEDCGAAELICQLLKEPNLELRMPLTSELLIFAIAFLIGGNLKC